MARVEIQTIVLTAAGVPSNGASVQVNQRDSVPATVYVASTGGTTASNPITTTIGAIPGWLDPGSYDLVITDAGLTRTVHYEAVGGTVEGRVTTLETAISADPRFPTTAQKSALAGTYNAPSASNPYMTKDDRVIAAPVGEIALFPSANISPPLGWIACYSGATYLISAMPTLATLLGTTFGALSDGMGNAGSTHFAVPALAEPVLFVDYIMNTGLLPSQLVASASPTVGPTIAFGNDAVSGGTGVTITITMRSNGSGPIDYGAVTLAGTNAAMWTFLGSNTTADTLRAPGSTSDITLKFRATSTGAKTAQVQIVVDNNVGISPITISLTGTGT